MKKTNVKTESLMNSMNPVLFNKHAKIKSSPVYLAYLILSDHVKSPNRIKKDKKVPIYSIFNQIKKMNPNIPSKQIYYALLLMFSLNLATFERPHVIIKKHDKD